MCTASGENPARNRVSRCTGVASGSGKRRGGTGLAHTASPTTTLLRWLAQALSAKAATAARRRHENPLPRWETLDPIFTKSP
jgi:hypothetical protein